jgi:hypothetical protein
MAGSRAYKFDIEVDSEIAEMVQDVIKNVMALETVSFEVFVNGMLAGIFGEMENRIGREEAKQWIRSYCDTISGVDSGTQQSPSRSSYSNARENPDE